MYWLYCSKKQKHFYMTTHKDSPCSTSSTSTSETVINTEQRMFIFFSDAQIKNSIFFFFKLLQIPGLVTSLFINFRDCTVLVHLIPQTLIVTWTNTLIVGSSTYLFTLSLTCNCQSNFQSKVVRQKLSGITAGGPYVGPYWCDLMTRIQICSHRILGGSMITVSSWRIQLRITIFVK